MTWVISHDECNYSGVIQDLIKTIEGLGEFKLKIWVDGCEIPFTIESKDNTIEFLQESIKIISDSETMWILYGIIMMVVVST